MIKIEKLLPIGSVVLLKEGEKRLMIIGILQTDGEQSNKEYDYLGIMYPEGNVGEGFQYLFNHEDIEQIYFRGYEDEERAAFIERLATLFNR